MQINLFYIIIENRYYKHENDNEYHIERLCEKEEAFNVIKNDAEISSFLIITNDSQLLSTYIVTLNEEELKMLCGKVDFDKKKIRINKSFFENYESSVFYYYEKIKNNECVSASMKYNFYTIYPFDDPTIGVLTKDYIGWVVNKEFLYLKTPSRYLNDDSSNVQFHLDDVTEANLKTFEKLLNVNILEIGNDDKIQNTNWENRKGLLRYYDKISSKRLYISQENLNELKNKKDTVFLIETKLDSNFYIEYYVIGVKNIKENFNDENEMNKYKSDCITNDCLRNTSDTDDPEIMNDVYWNLE